MSRQKVMWMQGTWGRDGGWMSTHHTGTEPRPVLVTELDPDDLPPEWAMVGGTKVLYRVGLGKLTVGRGDLHRGGDCKWWFLDAAGQRRRCIDFEPIPTTETLTLRVTGSRGDVDAVLKGALAFTGSGLSVEVVEDEG